ncbi:hypothetical protein [Schlesneria sp.]
MNHEWDNDTKSLQGMAMESRMRDAAAGMRICDGMDPQLLSL